jgi:hypothetical protein
LKLSGIGPRAELESLGIPVVVANDEVGANLNDHATAHIFLFYFIIFFEFYLLYLILVFLLIFL